MSSGRRKREKPVSTGSIAFRIGLSSGFNLLLVFIVLDIALFCVFMIPVLDDAPGAVEFTIDSYSDASLHDPEIRTMAAKVGYRYHEEWGRGT